MALEAGSRLGHYTVTAKLGEGGMGEVWEATDTQLNRRVALKILPDAFAEDPDRLARFQREAQVLASLNHPGIAAIYGIEKSGDTQALVLELVDGPTLADRISKGPISADEALPIAKHIAEALEAAHEAGVIHRDLKPANVKLKADGTVKVLDFGLAKAIDTVPEGDAVDSPTMTAVATQAGIIMGTASYMSPEQARGKTVDRRADIWAFGAVLFEMLSGKRPFEGRDVSEVLGAVLRLDPEWDALPSDTPPRISTLLQRCLEKEPRQRVQAVGDARLAMEGAFETVVPPESGEPPSARVWQRPVPLALVGLGLVVITAFGVLSLRQPEFPPQPITRFSVVLPPDQRLTTPASHQVALSPDGSHLVYVANRQLYLRAIDELEATPIRGTEGGRGPFFSPDGQSVGFLQSGQLKRVALIGGAPAVLCDVENENLLGVSWGPTDTILFGQPAGILQVSGTGGLPEVVVELDAGERARQPQLLPDEKTVIFTLSRPNGDQARVVAQSLETGERRVLVEQGRDARYLPTGHLIYSREGTLFAAPFDMARLEVAGDPVAMVQDVAGLTFGAVQFDVSLTGSLIYVPATSRALRSLVWVDREGREEPLDAPQRAYQYLDVSADGERVALDATDQEDDIWIWDIARTTLTQLTFDPDGDGWVLWTPDGRRIVYLSSNILYWKAADGTGAAERLAESSTLPFPSAISPDGTRLIFSDVSPDGGYDLMTLPLGGTHPAEATVLLQTAANERNPALSPAGDWIAYESNASGQYEIYVRPFPDIDGGQQLVSVGGGVKPLWAPDGRELFYRAPGGRMMAVSVETGGSFARGNPQELFTGNYYSELVGRNYDIAPDGQRFLMIKSSGGPNEAATPSIVVVENWHRELLERVRVP